MTASASQSSRTETTRCVFPDVAPLCQSSERERDQNHVSPSASVRRRLSSFMYASVKTSRVRASCTIAGTSPRSSNRTSSGLKLIVQIPRHSNSSRRRVARLDKTLQRSSHQDASPAQIILHVADCELAEVKERRGEHRARAALGQRVVEMFELARAARRDDGYRNSIGDRARQIYVVAAARAV